MEFFSSDLESLSSIAEKIVSALPPEAIVLFDGEMGSGKTTLIAKICESLGVEESTSSPTFSLVNEYQTKDGKTIYHFDFYRIESIEEALDMGIEEYFYSGNLCLIEWPDKISDLLPSNSIRIKIRKELETRKYTINT